MKNIMNMDVAIDRCIGTAAMRFIAGTRMNIGIKKAPLPIPSMAEVIPINKTIIGYRIKFNIIISP